MKVPTIQEQIASWGAWARNDRRRGWLDFAASLKMLEFWDVPLGKPEAIFGGWAVTSDGVECLVTPYLIERRRIREDNWYQHVSQKVWMEGYEEDLWQALQYENARREQFKALKKSYFHPTLKAYQHIYQAERNGFLAIEKYESHIPHYAHVIWRDRSAAHQSPAVALIHDGGGYQLHCDMLAYPNREGGTSWFQWSDSEKQEILSFLEKDGKPIGLCALGALGQEGSTELWLNSDFNYARHAATRLLALAQQKRPPPPPESSRIITPQPSENDLENPMVKLFKDGKALALQTDASDEAKFTRDFATALQDYITSPKFEGQHEIETYLKSHVEICCKIRGYKADVREQRVLTVGDINPSSETLVNVTEYGSSVEEPQELKAVA